MTDDRKDEQGKRPSWQLPQERQPESDAYHIWTPRPLLRSIYWKPDPPPPFETVSATYEIFLDQRAWLTMHEHVWQTGADRTPFGYLIGDLCEDPNANRRFVTITAALPARFDFREDATDQISREATLALQLEVERRRGVLAGWYHRHLGGEAMMSEADVATHHRHFSEPWHCAFLFVGGEDHCEGGCFRSTPEAFAGDLLLPFYEMASNESLLARGLKRSYLDWSNYTTVDEIRSEPPPRPRIELPVEAVSEPEKAEAETAPEAEPEDERLVVQPFDSDPDEAEDVEAADEESEEEPGAPDDEASEVAEREAPEATDVEAADVDFEAAIDAVKPARIEMDYEREQEEPPGPPAQPSPPEPDEPDELTADSALAGAGLEVNDAPAKPHEARASRKPRLAARRDGEKARMAAVAVGALLVMGALAWGALLLSDRSAAPEDAGAGPAADAELATPDGQGAAAEAEEPGVTAAQVDSAGRETLGVISRFYGRAVALDDGRATCEELGEALIAVENAWLSYNADYKAKFTSPLPELLAERDERLYAGTRDVERLFDESECPRP